MKGSTSAARHLALIVGAGRMGSAHARIARSLGFQTATVDPYSAADHRRLCEAPAADVVVVATPVECLAEVAHAALDRGARQLLLEKPMACDTLEAQDLLAHARSVGIDVFIDYNERYHPVAGLVKEELLAQVGDLHRLRFERHGPAPAGPAPGSCLDLAVHDIDLMRFFGCLPRSGAGEATYEQTRARFDCGGVEVSLSASYRPGQKVRRFWVHGSLGQIHGDLIEGVVHVGLGDALEVRRLPYEEPLRNLWRDLVRGEGARGTDGLEALALAEAIDFGSVPRSLAATDL